MLCKDGVIRLWPDSTVFIIGGGPSLIGQDLCLPQRDGKFGVEGYLHDQHVIGVNNAYQLGKWVDICFWGDGRWWWQHEEPIKYFRGYVASCHPLARHLKFVNYIEKGKAIGIEERHDRISWNRSTGGAAINLGYHLGANRIVLIGFDMQSAKNSRNWHKEHTLIERKNIYKRYLVPFDKIAKDADKLGIEILNATPNSMLKIFPMVDLIDCI